MASAASDATLFPPDSRRVVFDMRVLVHACSNIPHQTNARVHCKWKVASTKTPSRHGRLPAVETKAANLVVWNAAIDLPRCLFRVDKDSMQLKPMTLRLSVRLENCSASQRTTKLGIVQIDMAEFAGQTGVDRTYLLEKARLNSTLNVTIQSTQIGGDVMFRQRCETDSDCVTISPGGNQMFSRLKMPSIGTIQGPDQIDTNERHVSSHTIYQVVGDILRISEENRSSRNSSHLDVTQQ